MVQGDPGSCGPARSPLTDRMMRAEFIRNARIGGFLGVRSGESGMVLNRRGSSSQTGRNTTGERVSKNDRTPLAKCSGREGGKAREAGRGERPVGQPSCEAVKVEGRGGRHGLQAGLGQSTVAGLAQAERAHALRERTLDPLALGTSPTV